MNLGNPPSFFYTPTWSPDSKKIAYTDKRLQLWYIDLDNPTPKLVDSDYFGGFGPTQLGQTWSPDNKWIAYIKTAGQRAARRLCLLARAEQDVPGHRWYERCAQSVVRQEW